MPVTAAEIADLTAILREAARVEIMPRFARLDPSEIQVKAHASDFVTIADEAAERFIEARVAERFGEVFFLGEEIMERDPARIDGLPSAARAIVVDPIDGTFNFANGIPAFAVIAAVVEHGEVTGGVIVDPVRDDAVSALAGEGAFIETAAGRHRLHVRPAAPLAEMHGAASWAYAEEPLRSRILAGSAGVWGTYNYRCGGQEMRLLATGGAHFALYNKLTPWDHAAGWLIHREAGGHSARFDGSPYRPEHRGGGLLMAPDAASWQLLRDQFLG